MRRFAVVFIAKVSFIVAVAGCVGACFAQQAGQNIDLSADARIVLSSKGEGVQIYACTAAGEGFKWTLKGPDAKLLDATGREIGTHFAGPTWKLADGSMVQGEVVASRPAPQPDAVPWLLLRAKAGTASGSLASVAFIRRTATHGGIAPATGCAAAADADKSVRIPYSATYNFYSAPK